MTVEIETPRRPSRRDARVDVLRGLALFMIFVDHIPGDALNLVTLHNFGFCDAAEVFVLLAGFSSMMAYGRSFERDGTASALRRIAARCLRIYLVHVALLVVTLLVVWRWTRLFHMEAHAVAPLLASGAEGLGRALTLRALPGYLDILPLYIVLLAFFPLIYLAMRRGIGWALAGSAAVWLAANLDHGLNLPNWIDGKGWYFNPFAWQFLFAIGAALARLLQGRDNARPRRPWIAAVCVLYLGFAFLQSAPWSDWGLHWTPLASLRVIDVATLDKSHLSPLRIADILALMYLLLTSRRIAGLMATGPARLLAVCGKHSLEVFAVSCVVALFGRLLFRTVGGASLGQGLALQLGVNAAGFVAMAATALTLEHRRDRRRSPSLSPQPSVPAGAAGSLSMTLPFGRWLRPALLALPLPLLAGAASLAPLRAAAAPPAAPSSPTPAPASATSRIRRGADEEPDRDLPHVAHRLAQHGTLRIVAFGSSSTQGIGASTPAAAYPIRLQHELSALLPHATVTVINQGVGGEDAIDMARRLPGILAQHPDLVIFQTGTNDPLRGVSVAQFEALTRAEVARLQQAGIDVMLMEPQLCRVTQATPSAVLYRNAVRQLGRDLDVPVIRRWDLMQSWLGHQMVTPAQLLAPDGLHMADAGYALLAKEVAREILRDVGITPAAAASQGA